MHVWYRLEAMKLKKQRQEISRTASRAEVCKTTALLGKSVEGVQIAQKDHLAGKVTLSCPPLPLWSCKMC